MSHDDGVTINQHPQKSAKKGKQVSYGKFQLAATTSAPPKYPKDEKDINAKDAKAPHNLSFHS